MALGLEGVTEYTQDWECEVANIDQLPKYINYYKIKQLNLNEKITLMRIILKSYNDYIEMNYNKDEYGGKLKICWRVIIIYIKGQ